MQFHKNEFYANYYKTILFFFISLALIIEGFIYFFNFITPLLNLINGIIQFGIFSLVFNDYLVIINLIYALFLIILGYFIYIKKILTGPVKKLISIIIILYLLKNPIEILNFINFLSVIIGLNHAYNLLPSYELFIYLLNWGLIGCVGLIMIIFALFNSIKFLIQKNANTNFIKFLFLLLNIYALVLSIQIIFNIIFEIIFEIYELYYLIQSIIYLISIYMASLFLYFKSKNKISFKKSLLINGSLLLFGIFNILEIFNEINIELIIVVYLQIMLGTIIIIIGILFNGKRYMIMK